MTFVTDWVNTGFWPLQDWSYEASGEIIGTRKAMAAARIESQPDIEGGAGPMVVGSDAQMGTFGDVHPWLFMQSRDRAERDMGSWMTMSVGMVMGGDTHYAKAEVQPFYDEKYYNDIGYALQEPTWAQGTPYPVKGQWRLLFPGTQEDEQHVLSVPIDGRLIAPSNEGPAQAGTVVVDLQPRGEMCLDSEEQPGVGGRAARLQTLVRVLAVEPGSGLANKGGKNVLALNWGKSPLDGTPNLGAVFMPLDGGAISGPTTGGSNPPGPITGPHGAAVVLDNPGSGIPGTTGGNDFGNSGGEEERRPHEFGEFDPKALDGMAVALMTKGGGGDGPITPGSSSDRHNHGTDRDGHKVNAAHISSQAFYYYNQDKDAPLEFSADPYPRGGGLPLTARVNLSYDEQSQHPFDGGLLEGLWRWWCESPIVNPTEPPSTPTPPTGGPGGPQTGGPPGGNGGGNPNPGGPNPGGGNPGPIKPGGRPGGPTTGGQPRPHPGTPGPITPNPPPKQPGGPITQGGGPPQGGGNTGPGGNPGAGGQGGQGGAAPGGGGPLTGPKGKRMPEGGHGEGEDPDPGSGEPNGGGSEGGGSGGSTNDPCHDSLSDQENGETNSHLDSTLTHATTGEGNPLSYGSHNVSLPSAHQLHRIGLPQTNQYSYAGPGGGGTVARDNRVDMGRLEGRNPHTNRPEKVPGIVPTVGSAGRDQVGSYALFHPFAEGFAAVQWRPQVWVGGAPNIEHNPQIPGAVLMQEERVRPQVLTMRAFGGMGDTDYNYVERPDLSRARGGTAHGGILLSPPRFEMEDYLSIGTGQSRDVDEVTGDEATDSLFMLAPGVRLTFGKPERNGTASNGAGFIENSTDSTEPLKVTTQVSGASVDLMKFRSDSGEVAVELAGAQGVNLPRGTDAQRPSALREAGTSRWNSTHNVPEWWNGGAWVMPQFLAATGVSGSVGGSIANDEITFAKMQDLSANTLMGSVSGGDPSEITCTSAGRALLDDADAAAQRTTIGLEIGANVQAWDAALDALAGLSIKADSMFYGTGTDAMATVSTTSYGRSLLATADAAALRAALTVPSLLKAIGSSTASISNLTVDLTWSSPEITHDNITVSGSDITFDTGGTYEITCSAHCDATNRVELIVQMYKDTGSGYSALTNEVASNYATRDTDQNTGSVTLATALTVNDGDAIKLDCLGDADSSVSLTVAGTILRITGPY